MLSILIIDKTSKTLATYLSKINKSKKYQDIIKDIDRAHRSKKQSEEKKDEPRPIFVKFTSWKNAQLYKSFVVKNNKYLKSKGKSVTVFVDQMYSQNVSERRKQAFEARKKLREEGENTKTFVKYPATLMKQNAEGKFIIHTVF